jgi:hypothetical protein
MNLPLPDWYACGQGRSCHVSGNSPSEENVVMLGRSLGMIIRDARAYYERHRECKAGRQLYRVG